MWYIIICSRECWNWQTGKTKDLVGVCSCGFKSHLPQMQKWRNWQTRTVQVRVVAIPCGFDSHLLQFMKTLEMLGFVVITSVFRGFVVGEVSWVMGSIPLRSISLSGFAL